MDYGKYVKPPWLALEPAITNSQGDRSQDAYEGVCSQFGVEKNPRYRPQATRDPSGKQGLKTFCNIYVWDCTKALGCEIPHWVAPDGGPAPAGKGKELRANDMLDWLREHGKERGWMNGDEFDAKVKAAAGFPTIALWFNPTGGPGHVVMVLDDELNIAQAGARNFVGEPLSHGFGAHRPIHYFWHE